MKRPPRTYGTVSFPGDPIDGMRVATLGVFGGYHFVEALEARPETAAGDKFVWPLDNLNPQLELALGTSKRGRERLARATQSHVPPSNVPPGHTTQGGIGKSGG